VLEAVRKGLGVMPPFADKLSPEQIEAVAAFVAKAAGGQ
jgi:mono/diheme cytochrome c family protein